MHKLVKQHILVTWGEPQGIAPLNSWGAYVHKLSNALDYSAYSCQLEHFDSCILAFGTGKRLHSLPLFIHTNPVPLN